MGSPDLSQIECAPARDVRRGGRCCLAFSFYKKNAISYAGRAKPQIDDSAATISKETKVSGEIEFRDLGIAPCRVAIVAVLAIGVCQSEAD